MTAMRVDVVKEKKACAHPHLPIPSKTPQISLAINQFFMTFIVQERAL
jgi:hypothetical protein